MSVVYLLLHETQTFHTYEKCMRCALICIRISYLGRFSFNKPKVPYFDAYCDRSPPRMMVAADANKH